MLIVQLYAGQNCSTGDYVYRIEQPARWLSKIEGVDVLNIDLLNVDDWSPLIKAPLLILHHLSDPDLLPVVTRRLQLGRPTVYELADNFRASQEHLQNAEPANPPEYHLIIEQLIKRCDAVQTTGKNLADQYSHLNERFLIFPNLVDDVHIRPSESNDKFTVGWGGSVRHFEDIAAYAPALTDWVKLHRDVRLAIMGSQRIQDLFKQVPATQLAFYTPGSLQSYLAFLDELDAGIAPLLPTAFNACRSDVKFLEYASRQVVPLCSRFGPYFDIGEENESILFFGDSSRLIDELENLRMHKQTREKIAKQAQTWVKENRLTSNYTWHDRIKKYKRLVSNEVEIDARVFDELLKTRKSRIGSTLAKGMQAPIAKDSLTILRKAAHGAPRNYQAQYFLGWRLSRAGQYDQAIASLQRAFALNPESIRSAQLLAQTLILHLKIDEAQNVVHRALDVEPDLESLRTLEKTTLKITEQLRTREPVASH